MDRRNIRGFTLIEVLVALTILAIILLGLLRSLLVYYDISTKNMLRNEAIRIAYEYANKYKNMNITDIPSTDSFMEERDMGNARITYSVEVNSESKAGGKIKELTLTVKWTYKGTEYSHTITTLVGEDG